MANTNRKRLPGVFGQLILNGQCPSTTWVKLGASAAVGETVITLAEAADSSWLNKEVKNCILCFIWQVYAACEYTVNSFLKDEHYTVEHH